MRTPTCKLFSLPFHIKTLNTQPYTDSCLTIMCIIGSPNFFSLIWDSRNIQDINCFTFTHKKTLPLPLKISISVYFRSRHLILMRQQTPYITTSISLSLHLWRPLIKRPCSVLQANQHSNECSNCGSKRLIDDSFCLPPSLSNFGNKMALFRAPRGTTRYRKY